MTDDTYTCEDCGKEYDRDDLLGKSDGGVRCHACDLAIDKEDNTSDPRFVKVRSLMVSRHIIRHNFNFADEVQRCRSWDRLERFTDGTGLSDAVFNKCLPEEV